MKSSCNADKKREPGEEKGKGLLCGGKRNNNKKKKPKNTPGGIDLHVRPLVHTHRRQEMQPASKLLTLILLIFMGTELTQVGLLF